VALKGLSGVFFLICAPHHVFTTYSTTESQSLLSLLRCYNDDGPHSLSLSRPLFLLCVVCVAHILLILSTAPDHSIFASLYAAMALFLIRNALMNSVFGITRSVIMDCVSKESRAKWSAFESLSSLTWAGSATIGGYIVAAKDYRYVFTITAVLQMCGIALLLPASIGARRLERQLEAEAAVS